MDEIRYGIALVMVCLVPGTLAYWLSIHPFVSFWRRLGAIPTFTLHLGLVATIGFAVASQRRWILSIEFGNHALLAAAGVTALVLTMLFRRKVKAELSISTLIGLPELDPVGRPQPLITTGVYAIVRHPRYLQLLLAFWGWALLANYLALYILAALAMAIVRLLVLFEENELSDRYGSAYCDYSRRVPRFIPRFPRRASVRDSTR